MNKLILKDFYLKVLRYDCKLNMIQSHVACNNCLLHRRLEAILLVKWKVPYRLRR